jgi:hypothetical protein
MTTAFDTIGDATLSAWREVPGVRVQTRSFKHARRLSQRSDGRLIAWGVSGGYLRVFWFKRGMAWAARLIKRYTRNETPTNAGNISPIPPSRASERETDRLVSEFTR